MNIWNRLSRIAVSSSIVPELEVLRFVAIAAVFFHHMNGYLLAKSHTVWSANGQDTWLNQSFFFHGNYGVQLFFLISGFVLALPFAKSYLGIEQRQVTALSFYKRRISRLFPPYYFNILIFFFGFVALGFLPTGEALRHLFFSLLYLHVPVYGDSSPFNTVSWSLEVEVHFCILAPLLIQVFRIQKALIRRSLLVSAIVGLCCFQYFYIGNGTLKNSLAAYLQFFLLGFLWLDIYLTSWKRNFTEKNIVYDFVFFLSLVTFFFLLEMPVTYIFVAPWCLLLTVCAFCRSRFSNLTMFPAILTLGGMCYTIYLYHYSLISIAGFASRDWSFGNSYILNLLIQTVFIGSFVILVCLPLFMFIEKPTMKKEWYRNLPFLKGRP